MISASTFISPASAAIIKGALVAGDVSAASAELGQAIAAQLLRPGPLRVIITHEPFMPWFKLEYDGQTEELDHVQCLEWFRLRGATDLEAVDRAINHAFNFGRGTRGAVYSSDGSVALFENRPGVVVEIGKPVVPKAAPGQEDRYLPKI